jgi:hypothetical protein
MRPGGVAAGVDPRGPREGNNEICREHEDDERAVKKAENSS